MNILQLTTNVQITHQPPKWQGMLRRFKAMYIQTEAETQARYDTLMKTQTPCSERAVNAFSMAVQRLIRLREYIVALDEEQQPPPSYVAWIRELNRSQVARELTWKIFELMHHIQLNVHFPFYRMLGCVQDIVGEYSAARGMETRVGLYFNPKNVLNPAKYVINVWKRELWESHPRLLEAYTKAIAMRPVLDRFMQTAKLDPAVYVACVLNYQFYSMSMLQKPFQQHNIAMQRDLYTLLHDRFSGDVQEGGISVIFQYVYGSAEGDSLPMSHALTAREVRVRGLGFSRVARKHHLPADVLQHIALHLFGSSLMRVAYMQDV